MSKIYKYIASYADEDFCKHVVEIESTADLNERKRAFEFECAVNGWDFIYFRRAN